MNTIKESGLVCIPDAISKDERTAHFALARELFQNLAIAQYDLPDGYVIRFSSDMYNNIVRFVGNERKCCPALKFEIEISPSDAGIVLRLRGPKGAREFIKSELPMR